MSFNGRLEDLSIVDVLQLLHATKKSGTLHLRGPKGEASLSLREGFLISARHPDSKENVGKILIQNGAVTKEALAGVIEEQKQAGENAKPLVAMLLEKKMIPKEEAWRGLQMLIERTVSEIVSWKAGQFELDIQAALLSDDYRFFPEEYQEGISLDAQMVLLNALRIFDEKQADLKETDGEALEEENVQGDEEVGEGIDPGVQEEVAVSENAKDSSEKMVADHQAKQGLTAEDLGLDELEKLRPVSKVQRTPGEKRSKAETRKRRLEHEITNDKVLQELTAEEETGSKERVILLFSRSGFIKHSIRTLAAEDGIDAQTYTLEKDIFDRLGQFLRKNIIPIVVMDAPEVQEGARGIALYTMAIEKLKGHFPEIPVIQLVLDPKNPLCAERLATGVRLFIPRPPEDLAREKYVEAMKHTQDLLLSAWRGIFRERNSLVRETLHARGQMARLRQRVQQMRNSTQYPDVSLLLLQIVAETMERAVIFLVRPNDILGVGTFGLDDRPDEKPVMFCPKIPLSESEKIQSVVIQGSVFFGKADSTLERYLLNQIGIPSSSDILLLPLRTQEKTVALIYGDFGDKPSMPVQIEALEVLAFFGGLLLENSLLRRQHGSEETFTEVRKQKTNREGENRI